MDKINRISLNKLADSWPSPFVTRNKIAEFSGGMVTPVSMAVFDSKGKGVADRFIVNRKTCYPVDSLVQWRESRVQ